MNMVIPINKKENIYLNEKYTSFFKGFFCIKDIKYLINQIDNKFTDNGGVYHLLFNEYIAFLENIGEKNNLLMRKVLPYFLMWVGFDFRKYYNIYNNIFYWEAFFETHDFDNLLNYKIGSYYDKKQEEY